MPDLQFTTLRRGARREGEIPLLRVKGLSVKVGIRRVLGDLDLELFEGDTVCVSGPNGSGKSTLLNAIAGLEPARIEAGTISLGGEDVTDMPPHARSRCGLAFMRQRENVFPDLSVEENLRVALGHDGPERFSATFPSWADELKGRRRAGLLSGGQKQRLAWAMVTLRPSRVLLADEPEAGMSESLPFPSVPTFLFVGHAAYAVARYCDEALHRWRCGERPRDADAWAMGRPPFIDELRRLVRDDDNSWLRSWIADSRPAVRHLAVNLARPVADDHMFNLVHGLWNQEPHLHTKLSMVFFLAYSPSTDWSEIMAFLDARRDEVMPVIMSWYQDHPRGATAAIAERLVDPAYVRSGVLYLFVLRELARRGDSLPAHVRPCIEQAETGSDHLKAALAHDVRVALDNRKESTL